MHDLFSVSDTAGQDPESERRALIALSLLPGVGATRSRSLVEGMGSASGVFRAPAHRLSAVRGISAQMAATIRSFDADAAVDQQLERAERAGARFVALGDDEYPDLLRRIYDPPLFFWVRGRLTQDDAHTVSVVGTRKATDYGSRAAQLFAAGLVEHGLTVVSGLAYGIDIAAHQAALDAGGRTIAVLGSGVDRVYPSRHTPLVRRIVEEDQGAVISEIPMGTDPARGAFPSRNRIVAGMGLGTLVVESGTRGGALLTAAMALDQNREVFAVPAPVFSEMQGTNRLVQRGYAALVTQPSEIVEALAPHLSTSTRISVPHRDPAPLPAPADLSALERRLLDVLSLDPKPLDAVCAEAQVDASSALVYLLQLEFRGLVRQLAGKQFFRASG